ncbi:HIRAN domain-containing protein [Anaerosinus gibii]|uniref:HIRAN domain-containing protein n=1 Tax=Selenobaculum gibii TaxID=3054208 RepID=A0A9Y2AH00_9FIRM|nr:HIRAN domain-containing protein [Selenobaculum gbiensis]WIW70644.1 HIRAN domain-containing protein [Selenobaculum gbiensis]
MSLKDGRDYLYLIWKEQESKRRYTVAELSKNAKYRFQYGHEIKLAMLAGFEPLIEFPDIDKIYESEALFSVFASRLPDPKRKGIDKILKKYNLQEYNAYELLKKSGARLPIDKLEFIDPILDDAEQKRDVYIAGTSFHLGCKGDLEHCSQAIRVLKGDILIFKMEPNNQYDEYAVQVLTQSNQLFGYLPRYLSKDISYLLVKNKNVICQVVENNYNADCIKVKITIKKDGIE